MRDDLFFVPMIAEALRQPDPHAAMRDAFERVQVMGRDPRFQVGYQQFLRFMDSASESLWREAPEELGLRILDQMDRPLLTELVVERDDLCVAICSFDQPSGAQAIGDIRPGDYRLKTDARRVLWEGVLAPHDVLWADAFPGRDLPVAAETKESALEPTREIELLDGTLILRVYAGVEAGTLEIVLTTPESKE